MHFILWSECGFEPEKRVRQNVRAFWIAFMRPRRGEDLLKGDLNQSLSLRHPLLHLKLPQRLHNNYKFLAFFISEANYRFLFLRNNVSYV